MEQKCVPEQWRCPDRPVVLPQQRRYLCVFMFERRLDTKLCASCSLRHHMPWQRSAAATCAGLLNKITCLSPAAERRGLLGKLWKSESGADFFFCVCVCLHFKLNSSSWDIWDVNTHFASSISVFNSFSYFISNNCNTESLSSGLILFFFCSFLFI